MKKQHVDIVYILRMWAVLEPVRFMALLPYKFWKPTLVETTLSSITALIELFFGQVEMIMATHRPDVLDPALLHPDRLDRKIEIPVPNEPAGPGRNFSKFTQQA